MRITLPTSDFVDILSRLRKIIDGKAIESHKVMAKIIPEDGACRFVSFGSFIDVLSCRCTNIQVEEPAEVLFPIQKVYEIARNSAEKPEISLNFFEKEDEEQEAMACQVDVTFPGDKSRYKLQSLPVEGFPDAEEEPAQCELTLRQDDLANMFAKVSFSMGEHDPRHYLNGLLLEHDGDQLSAVATDGHRLARSIMKVEQTSKEKVDAILPRQLVLEIEKGLGGSDDAPVVIQIGKRQVKVIFDENTFIIAKVLSGKFPDYQRVIPQKSTRKATIDRQDMLSSLMRSAAILVTDSARNDHSVKLSFSGEKVVLQTESIGGDTAEVEQEVAFEGDDLMSGFNLRFLVEVMKAVDTEKVILQMQDALDAIRIIGDGGGNDDYVVMPLRL